ncbi:MAG TPA: hypothetical protein ENH29_03070, partial [Bacteroidetes bacterium]|nr:hypothetical protein [Bacteroidota bacterium]
MRVQLFCFSIFLIFIVSCRKALVPENRYPAFGQPQQSVQVKTNNLYFPDFNPEPPLTAVKQLRPSSAPQQKLQVVGNILFVPTKNGKIESYDLVKLQRINRYKIKAKIRANVTVAGKNLLVAKEYGAKSLVLLNPAKNKPVWSAKLGSIKSVPKTAGDRVFIASLYRGIFCLNLSTGEIQWQHKTASQLHTSPAVSPDRIYQITERGNLIALAADDGKIVWQTALLQPGLVDPVLTGDQLICATKNGKVFAISTDGKIDWQFRCRNIVRRAPAVSRTTVVVADEGGVIYALNRSTGRLLWCYDVGAIIGTNVVLGKKYIIIGTLEKKLLFV